MAQALLISRAALRTAISPQVSACRESGYFDYRPSQLIWNLHSSVQGIASFLSFPKEELLQNGHFARFSCKWFLTILTIRTTVP